MDLIQQLCPYCRCNIQALNALEKNQVEYLVYIFNTITGRNGSAHHPYLDMCYKF